MQCLALVALLLYIHREPGGRIDSDAPVGDLISPVVWVRGREGVTPSFGLASVLG